MLSRKLAPCTVQQTPPQRSDFISIINFFSLHHTTTSPDVRVGPAVTSEPKLSDASYAFPSNLSQLQFHRLGNQ